MRAYGKPYNQVEMNHKETLKQSMLTRLPDTPRWVETRDLLLWDGSDIVANAAGDGCLVWSEPDELGAVVGTPDPAALQAVATKVPELLAFGDNIDSVRKILPLHVAELAYLFSEPTKLPPHSTHLCRELTLRAINRLNHLPADLHEELIDAAEDGSTVVAAFDGDLPIAFAYVASASETLWDLSIDTLATHRRRGFASAAAIHLMHLMRGRGKRAVWGAVASNRASRQLAKRLGFTQVDTLWVLARDAT